MRGARRGRGSAAPAASSSSTQFKLSDGGEIKSIMSLLQPGQQQQPQQQLQQQMQQQQMYAPLQPQQDDGTRRSSSVPVIGMPRMHASSTTSSHAEMDGDDAPPGTPGHGASDNSVYHFRASVGESPLPSPGDSQQVIDALRGDIMSLQHALHHERQKGAGGGGGANKVAGAQFRMGGKEVPSCENCMALNSSLKKSKEAVRGLKLQLDRLQDKYVGLRKSKSFDDGMPQGEDMDALRRRADEYEEEVGRLKKSARTDQYTIEQLQKLLLELQLRDSDAQKQLGAMLEGNERADVQRAEQQRLLDKARADLGQYQTQLEAAELKLSRAQRGDESAQELVLEVARLKAACVSLSDERDALREELAQLQRDLQDSQARVEATENSRQVAVKAQEEMSELRNQAARECVEAKEAAKVAKKAAGEAEKARADTATQLADSKGQVAELATENVSLLQELQRVRQIMQDQDDAKAETQAALERAIAQSVRLCVVAPTVNVHVSDKKMKFRGGLQDKNLKAFLDQEILEKYSLLFKQDVEGMAPDGATSIQGWLQKLLAEMQKSIEMHVNNAMNSEGV